MAASLYKGQCPQTYTTTVNLAKENTVAVPLQFSNDGNGFQDGIATSSLSYVPYHKMLMFLTCICVLDLYMVTMTGNNRDVGD